MKKVTIILTLPVIILFSVDVRAQVGIGTTSPVTELQIYSPDESTTLTNFTQALGNGGVLIQTDYTANAYTPGIFWSTTVNNDTKPKAGIFLQETGSGTYMLFGTSNSYSTGITSSSTILDPSGNFGVGGTPESRFTVASTSAPKIILTPLANTTADPKIELHGNGTFSSEGFGMGYDNSVGDGYFYATYNNTDGDISFVTKGEPSVFGGSGVERMRIDADGNVGIGSAPDANYNLTVGGSADGEIRLGGTGTVGVTNNESGIYWHTSDNYAIKMTQGTWSAPWQQLLLDWPTGIELNPGNIGSKSFVRITNGTDVGLVSGGYFVSGSTTSTNIAIDDNEIMARNNGAKSALNFNADGGDITIHNNEATSTKAIIKDDGSVGLGTTVPTEKLHVVGSIRMVDGAQTAGDIMTSDLNGVASWVTPASLGLGDGIYGGDGTTPSDVDVTVTDNIDFDGGTMYIDGINNRVGLGTTTPANEVEVNGWIGRSNHHIGGLVGSYNNIGPNGTYTNPVYVIGSSYKPSTTTLSNMYGIGYTLSNSASFITSQAINTWGMYVASDGDARIFLGSNSSGNSYFNTGGNVGFNEPLPELPIHVNRVGATTNLVWNAGYFVSTKTTDMSDGFGTGFRFRIEDNLGVQNSIAQISAVRSGADNSGKLQFGTYSGGTLTNRMCILPSGNVGIGESSPVEKLDVAPNTDNSSQLGRAHVGYVGWADYAGFSHVDQNSTTSYALLQHANGGTFINGANGQYVRFRINNVDQMYLNTTGLGIGSTSPLVKLKVAGDIESNNQIRATGWLTGTGTGHGTEIGASGGIGYVLSYNRTTSAYHAMRLSGASISMGPSGTYTALVVNSSGNVGINTASPGEKLHVTGSIRMNDGNETAGDIMTSDLNGVASWVTPASLGLGDGIYGGDGTTPADVDVTVTDNIDFDGGTMFIDGTNDRIGIGTNSPSNKLELYEGSFHHWDNTEVYQSTTHDNSGANLTNNTPVFQREIKGRRSGGISTLFREQVRYNGDGTTRRGDYQAGVAQTVGFGGMQFRMTQTAADNSKITMMGNVGSYNPDVSVGVNSVKASNVINNTQGRNILQLDGNGTTLALFTSAGDLGIGTTTPGGQLELSLNEGRKPGSNLWTVTSDARLKNITGDYTKGLKELDQLNPITYRYKNVGEREFAPEILETEFVGFTAQEVQKVFPEAVGTDDDGYLSLNTHSILVAYLNAIKELKAENDAQKKVNELLEEKIEILLKQNVQHQAAIEELKKDMLFRSSTAKK